MRRLAPLLLTLLLAVGGVALPVVHRVQHAGTVADGTTTHLAPTCDLCEATLLADESQTAPFVAAVRAAVVAAAAIPAPGVAPTVATPGRGPPQG